MDAWVIRNTMIRSNDPWVSAVRLKGYQGRLENVLIVDNRAAGLNIEDTGAGVDLVNCTLSGNDGDGVAVKPESVLAIVRMTNCVIYGNTGFEISVSEMFPATRFIFTHSLIEDDVFFQPNTVPPELDDTILKSDPLFVDSEGGDYHLRADSPCIDAGTLTGAPSSDLEGTARPKGSGHDLGAYEAYLPVTLIPYTPDPTNHATPTLEWIDVPGAVSYTLQYSEAADFEPFTEIEGIPESRHTIGSAMPDGILYWRARAVDAEGTAGWWSWTDDFTVDTGAPTAVISNAPPPLTNITSASFQIGGEGVTHYRFKLNEGEYGSEIAVTTSIDRNNLEDREHTLSVIGKNAAGTWQSEVSPTTAVWTVDTRAPTITGLAPGPDPARSKTWTWEADEPADFRFVVNQSATWTFGADAYGAVTTAEKTEGEGTWYLHVQARDDARNESDVVTVSGILDNTPPDTTADPSGNDYASEQAVTLTCDDISGFACAATYYTTDGTPPTPESIRYEETPVVIGVDTTLKFFSVDAAGNVESVKTQTYTIDGEDPSVSITEPGDGTWQEEVYYIEGTAFDGGTGAETVEVKVFNGSGGHLNPSGQWVLQETWLTAAGTDDWRVETDDGAWKLNTLYTVTAKAMDGAGNTSETSISFTYGEEKETSTITCSLSKNGMVLGGGLRITGQISPAPASTGHQVSLMFKDADGFSVYRPADWVNAIGEFQYDLPCDVISKAGAWSVCSSWAGDDDLKGAVSDFQTLEVSMAESSITLGVSSPIKTGDSVAITGQFTPEPSCGGDLSGLPIQVDLLDPAKNHAPNFPRVVYTYSETGRFEVKAEDYSGFNAPGEWTIEISFDGNQKYAPLSMISKTITVHKTAGYAILVQGRNTVKLEKRNTTRPWRLFTKSSGARAARWGHPVSEPLLRRSEKRRNI